MNSCNYSRTANATGDGKDRGDAPDFGRGFGLLHAPLPLKLGIVAIGFAINHLLGAVLLGAAALTSLRGHPFHGHYGRDRGESQRGPRAVRRFGRGSGNSAFDAAQQDAFNRIVEDARAFDEFRRQQREAADREAFEHFKSNRPTPDAV